MSEMIAPTACSPPLLADTLDVAFERGLDPEALGRELRENQPPPMHRSLSCTRTDGIDCEHVLIRSDIVDGSDVFISGWFVRPVAALSPEPPRPPILIVPGGRGKANVDYLMYAARQCRAFVLGVDWIGCGDSSQVRGLIHSPQGNALLFDGEDYRTSYQFHNLRALLAALDFLLSRPGVELSLSTILGGSCGGFYTWNLAAIDPRIRHIFPTFGCGYLDLETRYVWEQAFQKMGERKKRIWLEAFDPGRRVDRITAQVFYGTATNDKFFSILSAMKTFRRVRAPKHLLLVHNQDHFMKPYNQEIRVLRHLLGDAVALPPPRIESVAWQPRGATVHARTNPARNVRVGIVYSGGNYTRSFGRFWRRVEAVPDVDGWVAELPVVDPAREIWFYVHAERTDANLGGSSEVYRVVPREVGICAPTAKFEQVYRIPDVPEWELPVGDRLDPKTEAISIDQGSALALRFAGGAVARGVMYCLEGDLIANGGYDAVQVRLQVLNSDNLSGLLLLLVTDYHAVDEQTYGVPLQDWIQDAGTFRDLVIPFDRFHPVTTRTNFWGRGKQVPLRVERLCGVGLYNECVGARGEVYLLSAGVTRHSDRVLLRRRMDNTQDLDAFARNPQVLIEITSTCNFACKHCASPFNERPKQHMPLPLFEKIVKQLPRITQKSIRLHIDGEPTLHPNFLEIVGLVNQQGLTVSLATNASRLDPSFLDHRMDMRITISPTPEDFAQRHPKVDFNAYTRVAIEYVRAWRQRDNDQALWIMVLLGYQRHRDSDYLEVVDEFIAEFVKACELTKIPEAQPFAPDVRRLFFKSPSSHLRIVRTPTTGGGLYPVDGEYVSSRPVKAGFCDSPWKRLAILVDGRLSCCCIDLSGGTSFTDPEDIWTEDIGDLWNNHDGVRAIREAFLDNRVLLPVCQRCLGHAPTGQRQVGFSN